MAERGVVPIRGFLMHITHYDPKWCRAKTEEKPFDLDMGLEIVDTMAEVGLNLLVIDCADGVAYRSHPELARHYTVPMSHLEKLAARAGESSTLRRAITIGTMIGSALTMTCSTTRSTGSGRFRSSMS